MSLLQLCKILSTMEHFNMWRVKIKSFWSQIWNRWWSRTITKPHPPDCLTDCKLLVKFSENHWHSKQAFFVQPLDMKTLQDLITENCKLSDSPLSTPWSPGLARTAPQLGGDTNIITCQKHHKTRKTHSVNANNNSYNIQNMAETNSRRNTVHSAVDGLFLA